MHRESKKATKPQNKKLSKPDIIYEEEMEKKPPKSALDIDRISNS
ncbi:hypothetical protein [Clostridium sp. DJ247]|nr:hypothetical protein [Clostridium sp. DJ247]